MIIVGLLLLQRALAHLDGIKILAATMDQGRSHASSFMPLLHRLQKDNHSVALEMTIYEKELSFSVHEEFIDMTGHPNPFKSEAFIHGMWTVEFDVFMQNQIYKFGSQGCRQVVSDKPERLEEIARKGWHLVMVDSMFSTCGYGLAELSGAPVVILHSSDLEPAPGTMKAFGRNYGILPKNHMIYGVDDMNPARFWHRLLSSVEWFLGYYFYAIRWGGEMTEVLRPVLHRDFSYTAFHSSAAFSFVDLPDMLFPPAPRTNDIFFHGSYCPKAHTLDEEWQQFVENPTSKGTIIIAFGTYVDWSVAPREKREAIRQAINELTDYRIVWSYKGVKDWRSPPIEVGPHVRMHEWIPQSGLLHHNKTMLIVTHGGLKSVREAICCAVPAIFMPFFAEQARNAFLVRRAGFAEMLDRHYLSKEIVLEKILSVISTTTHADAARKFISEMSDRIMPGLDEAAFHVNRLVKKRGPAQITGLPDYFYPAGRKMDFGSYLNLDLIVALPLALLTFLSL